MRWVFLIAFAGSISAGSAPFLFQPATVSNPNRFTPRSLPALTAWFESDRGIRTPGALYPTFVATWTNQVAPTSGNFGESFIVGVPQAPNYGFFLTGIPKPSVQTINLEPNFDGSQLMLGSTYLPGDFNQQYILHGEYSMVFALRLPLTSSPGCIVGSVVPAYNTVPCDFEFDSNNRLRWQIGGDEVVVSNKMQMYTGANTISAGNFYIISLRLAATNQTCVLRINGIEQASAGPWTNILATPGAPFCLGAFGSFDQFGGHAGFTHHLSCNFYGILIGTNAWTDQQLAKAEGYFSRQFAGCAGNPIPAGPSGLSSANVSLLSTTLNWTNNAIGYATGFEIWREIYSNGSLDTPYTIIGSAPVGATTYLDDSAENDSFTSNHYKIRATNSFGQSAFSGVVTTP